MQKSIGVWALFGALLAWPVLAQTAAQPRRLGNFQDWTAAVHQERGQKVCYAFARASRSEPQRAGVLLLVTHRPGSRDQVALRAGYAYPRNAEATVTVGDAPLRFYTNADSAFARDGRAAVAAFRNGREAAARGPAASGRGQVNDVFSMRGFSAAYDAITRECPVARR
ncbi:MAG: invasion associated locus B family protein [Pseudomonadota bacterium]